MKVVVVGCTHAGTAAVVNIKENYPDSEVVIYEKNNNVSFLSCGIALNVGKVIDTTEKLFYSSPEALNSLGAQTKMQHEVLDIDFKNKKLSVKNLLTNEVFEDNYDKLVLTLGSWPIVPKFEGGTLDNIVLCKNYNHALNIIEKSKDAKNVVVIGAGYIGVELAEAFEMQGKNTTLIDAENRIMAKYLDKEFTDIAETEFKNKGVNIVLGQKVQKFEGTDTVKKVITDKGEYNADLVVLCIGFAPNTKLVQGKLETLPNGAIIGTSSIRRAAQIKSIRNDLNIVPIRGNVGTRLEKMKNEGMDGIILAAAGLKRLGMEDIITEYLNPEIFVPAVSQGALGIECLKNGEYNKYFRELDNKDVRVTVEAERSFMRELNGGCHSLIGAYATLDGNDIYIIGTYEVNGTIVKKDILGKKEDNIELGRKLAQKILKA